MPRNRYALNSDESCQLRLSNATVPSTLPIIHFSLSQRIWSACLAPYWITGCISLRVLIQLCALFMFVNMTLSSPINSGLVSVVREAVGLVTGCTYLAVMLTLPVQAQEAPLAGSQ
ncbi:uncharacterized protein EI90DRAFT_1574060 [Cantharellus anzutake]|uniref:uncharacterized protein n=1 Tax=Cantharellus anzutake TaxID=1750568 RepID=UPI0019085037|nr:uncharacterized protein EI90DRAFT_1574060 [Cantharellus anzutake]KAF8328416.1 hypothetical protein EI90DRAFT_1574060 [Cantharellus anzutake]